MQLVLIRDKRVRMVTWQNGVPLGFARFAAGMMGPPLGFAPFSAGQMAPPSFARFAAGKMAPTPWLGKIPRKIPCTGLEL